MPVFPGLHHISLRILCFPFDAERATPVRNLVYIFPKSPLGFCVLSDRHLSIIHCRMSAGTCKSVSSSLDKSGWPVRASADST